MLLCEFPFAALVLSCTVAPSDQCQSSGFLSIFRPIFYFISFGFSDAELNIPGGVLEASMSLRQTHRQQLDSPAELLLNCVSRLRLSSWRSMTMVFSMERAH
jgi:hypothetical protein